MEKPSPQSEWHGLNRRVPQYITIANIVGSTSTNKSICKLLELDDSFNSEQTLFPNKKNDRFQSISISLFQRNK